MTEHKFTDGEIIRALERCIACNAIQIANCDGCSLENCYPNCDDEIEKMSLDLINRQREEIEVIKETTAEIRYEAVKEFADSIKTYYDHIDKTVGALINYTIDKKLEEFLGEEG